MTDEQIKQNAEAYAEEHMVRTDGGGWEEEYDFEEQKAAYIAGAHSRDEEIKELQNELESLRKGFYERGDKLKELMLANNKLRNDNKELEQALAFAEDTVDAQKKKLDKLRNPWISVEKRLPEEDKDNEGYSVKVIGLFESGGKKYISDCFYSIEEGIWFIDIFTSDQPIAWTPINYEI